MSVKNATSSTAKITFIITIIAAISKTLGFARDAILAHFYGSTTISDIFLTTLSLPDILFELIANAITIGFIPIATGIMLSDKSDNRLQAVNKFSSNVITIFELLGVVFVVLFYVFSKPIIHLVAPGFEGGSVDIAVLFLRIISLSILFKTISNVLGAYMQTNKTFVPVSMYGAIMDLAIIAFIFLSRKYGSILLAVGVIAGLLSQMVFAIICARRIGFKFRFTFDLRDSHFLSMLIMFIPALAATGANQIIQLVNKGMATTVMEGGVTMISNANKMGYAAENIIVLSIAAVIYPMLSHYASTKNIDSFKKELLTGLNSTFVLMIPLSIALAMYAHPVIDLLFGHGAYVDAVDHTATLMKIYCIGILGLSSYTVMIRALYAQKMVKQSALCAIIALVINIILCLSFSKYMGLGLIGIASATSITYILSFCMAILFLYKRIGNFGLTKLIIVSLKCLLGCVPMAVISWFVFSAVNDYNRIIALLSCAIVGVIVYFAMVYWLKVDEAVIIMKKLKSKVLKG